MRVFLSILFSVMLACSVGAQKVMDGSETAVPKGTLDTIKDKIGRLYKDPYGTQIRNLRIGQSDYICGEINAKNEQGAFTGFRPFAFDPRTTEMFLKFDDDEISPKMRSTALAHMGLISDRCGLKLL